MTILAREKFQALLRDLFQFDCADLDFGIYRIMNHKRQVIEKWIAEDLPRAISEELQRGALAEQGEAQEALQAARQKVLDALGDDALDADGNLVDRYRETKAGKEYLEAQAKARGARSTEALEAAVYNHLYTFFSRYWQDGDFISKRRYSRKERYAIPYNGEEVYLYWANHDQYYIKTGEYFTDYSYKAPNGVTVHFKLQQAHVEQNNVKGEKRFFLPMLDGIAWDQTTRTLTIPFVFRPLTEKENTEYGQKNQQEAIIAKAVKEIPERVKVPEALAALTTERRKTEKGESVSWLEHHLRQYTRRNTSDFFIHKDLRGFLSRELDFYLKNEVLNLDEMEAAGKHLAEGWFQLMRLVKRIGGHIIDFLAQIEDFQKMLWEKKKFITETFYVITVGNIPKAFYPEIADCEAQWEEWRTLLGIEVPPAAIPSPQRGEGQGEGIKSRTAQERNALLKQFARDMRHALTDAEQRLWYFLRDRRLGGYKFQRQHPMGNYIADFICIEARLIVELDGGQHAMPEQAEKDIERTRFFESRGFRVLRFWNHEVLSNTEGVLATILEALESTPHPNPLPNGERESYLQAHPTLPLDTRHFPQDFTDRLLAAFDNLDELTDGLLVHSENWQALNLLQEKYRERVKCIYIDPPYNTGNDDFLYRDNYQHSSWLTMMRDRLILGKASMSRNGAIFISIDDNETAHLRLITNSLWEPIGFFVWEKKKKGSHLSPTFRDLTEYVFAYAKDISHLGRLYGEPAYPNESQRLINRANAVRELIFPAGVIQASIDSGHYDAGLFGEGEMAIELLDPITVEKRIVTNKFRMKARFKWTQETLDRELEQGSTIILSRNLRPNILRSGQEERTKTPSSLITKQVAAYEDAFEEMKELFGQASIYGYPKPSALVSYFVRAVTYFGPEGIVLDFFAGSGTTGHAVINLNREDGGRRKFILVEMAQYFDTVLLPRIKKVTYTPEWKDGRPLTPSLSPSGRGGGEAAGEGTWITRSPRIVKVIRLESYEDALNNLTFDDASGQQALDLFQDDYLLHYMLKWETRHSETLLDVEKLQSPFAYKLRIHRDGETRERLVDLPETFNYLLGLDVQTRRVLPSPAGRGAGGEGRYLVYRGTLRNGRTVAVVWRETQGWTKKDYERDRDFIAAQKLTEGADEVFVNGDSLVPGARSLDPIFKERMFAGMEV